MSTLHFIYGLPGAGKTSLAHALAARAPAVALCEDDWIAKLAAEPIASLAQYIDVRRPVG